ncbi:MAG: hypothetical protein R3F62_30430, partial [Planctomycetota bacterium]
MDLLRTSLALLALGGLGCASVDATREPMPAHPGLTRVLDPDVEACGAPLVFSGDAEAYLVQGGRPPRPASGGRVGPIARPTLLAPANLAVVELAAYTERSALLFDSACVWEPGPWSPRLQAPGVDALRAIRAGLHAASSDPHEGWPPVGGPALEPFAQVQAIPSFLLGDASLPAIRAAAAGIGCEVVLVYARRTRVLEGHNACAALYPLLVGFLLPAEEVRVTARTEAALLDVASGGVLAVGQGEGRAGWSRAPV